ncbi:DNA-binding transcriptional MerR regulator [Flavobacterium endophyticum]|uniref:DNA-binding transcriptional MerR regulator n=1 Tax=Flavobacterium endophyticum TaxID=1540163 RepID=A0A495M1G9_9FLAO|nr:MerR family transcriptional regulator [Flavobacterium endophyticum]RKS18433.1 DNA-binding transcriptional MerR regulator [Flavobacterium endophyticum]
MNSIKSVFSIKDLENLSGIKAHTIRIWEKRYNILEPMRTTTNIRLYDVENLQKLLNITLLHSHGYKISKISKFPPEKIPQLVQEIVSDKSAKNHAINAFKMAMMNFDQTLFFTTYNELLSEKSFREVFTEIFIPLMNEIGILWQTGTITPSHEHFISYLIRQKLLSSIEQLQILEPAKKDKVFILYLPQNEIHELGLIYLNYEILFHGYKTIYLGQSIPIENLKDLTNLFDTTVFVSYWTVFPEVEETASYIKTIQEEILTDKKSELWILGKLAKHIPAQNLTSQISVYFSMQEVLNKL